jgi:hypothetical protein
MTTCHVLLAWMLLAAEPNYDAFCDGEGHIGTPEQVLAAQDMVRAPGQLEAVFAQAAKGNKRAARVFSELETVYFPDIGRGVAEKEHSLRCQTPVVKEFSEDCRPHWEYLAFLPANEAGARLFKAAVVAYEVRARRLGTEVRVIAASVNAVLAVGGAAMIIRSVDVGGFRPPQISRNQKGQLTNGTYTVNDIDMAPHKTGATTGGESQFLSYVDAEKATLDAAAYADKANLWSNNRAKVYVQNGPVGVSAKTSELTNWINVYRTDTRFVHGSPGNPP